MAGAATAVVRRVAVAEPSHDRRETVDTISRREKASGSLNMTERA